ncbi:Tfp pilus assembly protein FimT/FimU [Patescibacteria group bacterium]
MKLFHQKGFTSIELMAVIGIITILAAIGIPSYQTVRKNIVLNNYANEIVSMLRTAQNRSLSAQDGTPHGIFFEAEQYTIYGDDWSAPTYTTPFSLYNGIEILQGVNSHIVFDRLLGTTDSDVIVKVGFPGGREKTITIDAIGKIALQ